jgi:hypothetical protein
VRCGRHDLRAATLVGGVALVSLALLGAGCGNAKRDFRVHELNPRIERVGEQRAALSALLRDSRPGAARDTRALRAQLGRLAGAMRRVAALEPPDGAESRFRRYTAANAALLAGLSRFVDARASGSAAREQRAGQDIQVALVRVGRAQAELQHALQ